MSTDGMVKRLVRVTVETDVEVSVPAFMGTPEAIENFCKGLWNITGIDDIARHAGAMAAQFGDGDYDGLGKLVADNEFSEPKGDVRYIIVSTDVQTEVS